MRFILKLVLLILLLSLSFAIVICADLGDYYPKTWSPPQSNNLTAQRFRNVTDMWWSAVSDSFSKWNGISANARIISLSTNANPDRDTDLEKNIRIHGMVLDEEVYGETWFYKAIDGDMTRLRRASSDDDFAMCIIYLQLDPNKFERGYELSSPERLQYTVCHELGHCFKLSHPYVYTHGGYGSVMLQTWEYADPPFNTKLLNNDPKNPLYPHDANNIKDKWK